MYIYPQNNYMNFWLKKLGVVFTVAFILVMSPNCERHRQLRLEGTWKAIGTPNLALNQGRDYLWVFDNYTVTIGHKRSDIDEPLTVCAEGKYYFHRKVINIETEQATACNGRFLYQGEWEAVKFSNTLLTVSNIDINVANNTGNITYEFEKIPDLK